MASRSTVACAISLLLAVSVAHAQPCTAPLGKPGQVPEPNGEKFRLIAQQCDVAAEPLNVRRAAQLDLYTRGSVTITMSPEPDYVPAPAPQAPALLEASAPQGRDVARVMSLTPAITAAAQANNIDPLLLHAIAHVESRHKARAVSPVGARGVMQVMPDTARRFGVAEPERALFDAETNLRASASYLRTLRVRYGDDLRLVLAAYNAGEGAVDKYNGVPPYAETQAYVRDVLAVYQRLSASFAVAPTGELIAKGSK